MFLLEVGVQEALLLNDNHHDYNGSLCKQATWIKSYIVIGYLGVQDRSRSRLPAVSHENGVLDLELW